MTTISTAEFTKEQLFADLESDGIRTNADTLIKAKNGDGRALYSIGHHYQYKTQKYDKAMAWHQLAAAKNNSDAQTSIGILYDYGNGVPKDYSLAMSWFLKAAAQNNKIALVNIGGYFENGQGVPVHKYKALEWYYKNGEDSNGTIRLIKQGIQLTQQDKDKPIEQLIMETEHIIWPRKIDIRPIMVRGPVSLKLPNERLVKRTNWALSTRNSIALPLNSETKQMDTDTPPEIFCLHKIQLQTTKSELEALKQENHLLTLKNGQMEVESHFRNTEVASLKEEVQKFRAIAENQQQEITTYLESINQYKRDKQTIKNELQALKQANHTLMLKMEEESSAKNNVIHSLKEEIKTLQITSARKQKAITTHLKSIDEYKRIEQTINSELQALKQANDKLGLKMDAKENEVNDLQSENRILRTLSENSSQDTANRVKTLERSNQSLERMLEQVRRLKDGQIEVMKDKMTISLEKEKQKRNQIESKYRAIKRELKNLKIHTQKRTSKQGCTKSEPDEDNSTDSCDNETDYDTEYDSAGSDNNDINYDTPSEEDDDESENDLNYDSDEQKQHKNKTPPY